MSISPSSDHNPASAPSQHSFGLWRQDPQQRDRLLFRQSHEGKIFDIRLRLNSVDGSFSRVSIRIFDPSKSEAEPRLEHYFAGEQLSEELSDELRPQLLCRGSLSDPQYIKQIVSASLRFTDAGDLSRFAPSDSIIARRLSLYPADEVIKTVCENGLASPRAVASALRMPGNPLSRDSFKMFSKLENRVEQTERAAFFGKIANALYERGQKELAIDYLTEGNSVKHVRLALACEFLTRILNRPVKTGPMAPTDHYIFTNRSLLEPADCPKFQAFFSEQVRSRKRYDILADLLPYLGEGEEEFHFSKLPVDLLYEALETGSQSTAASFSEHIDRFPKADHQRSAEILLQRGFVAQAAPLLPKVKGLSLDTARQLAKSGKGEQVLQHLSAFKISTVEAVSVIRQLLESLEIETVLKSLQFLPPAVRHEAEKTELIESYYREIGVPSAKIYAKYRILKQNGAQEALLAHVQSINTLKEKMISSEPHDPALLRDPNYAEVEASLYHTRPTGTGEEQDEPNAMHIAGDWDEIVDLDEANDTAHCEDRTGDLQGMKFEPFYRINLASGAKMELPPGVALNEAALRPIYDTIRIVRDKYEEAAPDKRAVLSDLNNAIRNTGHLPAAITDTGAQVAAVCLRHLEGNVPFDTMFGVIVRFHFAREPHIGAYLRGSVDEAQRSKCSDYINLLNMKEFVSDRLVDTLREAYARFLALPISNQLIERLHRKLAPQRTAKELEAIFARHRADQLGNTPAFSGRLLKVLSNKDIDKKKRYQAVAGMISAEQRKIARMRQEALGAPCNPDNLSLYSFDPGALLQEAAVQRVRVNTSNFLQAYFANALDRVLSPAVEVLTAELAKFRTEEQANFQRRVVEACFTKNRASAKARAVGGVCVANDNPRDSTGLKSQWRMPNFFQLVLRDAVTKECEGLVLLHHYTDEGKRILTGSFNPSSTFLYKVDGAELFNGLLGILVSFAEQNNFDYVCCSEEAQIRTNRSGPFETSLGQTIRLKSKTISLSQPQPFSYMPPYKQQRLCVLWEKGDAPSSRQADGAGEPADRD